MSVSIENNMTGNQSDNFPNLDFPMKSPITMSTIGVTDAVIMSNDLSTIAGSVICRLPTMIPKITEINRGFVSKFFMMFVATSFLLFVIE